MGNQWPEVAREILASTRGRRPCSAVTDHEAVFLYEAAAELGIYIPRQLSVVGFADLDFAATLRPPLTTMRQHRKEIGRRAAQMILDRLDGGFADSSPTTIRGRRGLNASGVLAADRENHFKSLSENRRGLSRICGVLGANWDCPPSADGFRIGS